MSRWARVSLALLALLALDGCARARASEVELPVYRNADWSAEWIPRSERATVHRVAPFSFLDQDHRTVSRDSLAGKVHLASFFFTRCPSLCPKITRSFQRVQAAFADDAAVELVSFSVDPENDTPDVLARYAALNGVRSDKWHLVTGDASAVYALARTSYFAEKRLGLAKPSSELLHTENMVLVDRDGHLRGVYNATLPAEAERAIEDIRTLLRE